MVTLDIGRKYLSAVLRSSFRNVKHILTKEATNADPFCSSSHVCRKFCAFACTDGDGFPEQHLLSASTVPDSTPARRFTLSHSR